MAASALFCGVWGYVEGTMDISLPRSANSDSLYTVGFMLVLLRCQNGL